MIDNTLSWQLQRISDSRAYRSKLRIVGQLCDAGTGQNPVDVSALLGGILLIEMHQRPSLMRAIEWITSILVPKFVRQPITRGPLQIAEGPWNLQVAIHLAKEILLLSVAEASSEDAALYCAAAAWNGKAVRQPCSMYGYGNVLKETYNIAAQALTDLAHGSTQS